MNVLTGTLPANAQVDIVNSETTDMLSRRNMTIALDVQSRRPRTDWAFYGKLELALNEKDTVTDIAHIDTIQKLINAYDLSAVNNTIMTIYKDGDTFNSVGDKSSELVGFAVMPITQTIDRNSAEQERERALNERGIRDDIVEMTLWNKNEVFTGKITDEATGQVVMTVEDVFNHHRDLEHGVRCALKALDMSRNIVAELDIKPYPFVA